MIQLDETCFLQWSGGPFANKSYNGGNRDQYEAVALGDTLNSVREKIFTSKNGEAESQWTGSLFHVCVH